MFLANSMHKLILYVIVIHKNRFITLWNHFENRTSTPAPTSETVSYIKCRKCILNLGDTHPLITNINTFLSGPSLSFSLSAIVLIERKSRLNSIQWIPNNRYSTVPVSTTTSVFQKELQERKRKNTCWPYEPTNGYKFKRKFRKKTFSSGYYSCFKRKKWRLWQFCEISQRNG